MELKAKHTPGPWKAGTGWIYRESNGGIICSDFPGAFRDGGQAEANMLLIAAAPQLLALVKQYRAESIFQGAAPADLNEIDEVLRLAGEDI